MVVLLVYEHNYNRHTMTIKIATKWGIKYVENITFWYKEEIFVFYSFSMFGRFSTNWEKMKIKKKT